MQSPDDLNVQVCSCPPGYEGDPYTGCTQDPCNPSPCGENGICERNGEIQTILHYYTNVTARPNLILTFMTRQRTYLKSCRRTTKPSQSRRRPLLGPSPGPFTYKTRLRPHYAKQPFSAIVKTWPMVRLQLYLHQILLF